MFICLLLVFIDSIVMQSPESLVRRPRLKRSFRVAQFDNHGCDAVVSSCGHNGQCCDEHDACYKENACTAVSWFYLCEFVSR